MTTISDATHEHTRILKGIQARRDRRIAAAKRDYDRDTNAEIERWLAVRYGTPRQICDRVDKP